MEKNFIARIVLVAALIFTVDVAYSQKLNVGIAGLSHDHAHGVMNQYKSGEVNIIGIAESDKNLKERYKKAYDLPESIFYSSINEMLAHTKPDAVLAYNAIADHLAVVEACAPKGISVMVEKPLATTVGQADKMKALKDKYKIQILVNYETTWYPSNQEIYSLVNSGTVGEVRKMIVHDGHEGPVEIGCSKDFLAWLTDPVKNGGGAITDFGCYGANLMTWLMKGEAPVAVSAITHQIKPEIYPNVDDDATILLEYPNATGIVEASWNWPFSIKDWEVFGVKGYLHAKDAQTLEHRDNDEYKKLSLPSIRYKDNLAYLSAALKGILKEENDPSSFNVNMVVVKILAAAKESARTGKKVKL